MPWAIPVSACRQYSRHSARERQGESQERLPRLVGERHFLAKVARVPLLSPDRVPAGRGFQPDGPSAGVELCYSLGRLLRS